MKEQYFRLKEIPSENEQKSFEKGKRISAYTDAFVALYKGLFDKITKGQKLSFREAQEVLESTPGLIFPSGTTLKKILERFGNWGLVELISV